MHPSLLVLPPLSALITGEFIGLAVVLAGIAMAAAISITAIYFHHQRRRLWHETARIALEKGQPLPPPSPSWEDPSAVMKAVSDNQFVKYARRRQPRWLRDLRGGLIMLAIGAGIFIALNDSPHIERAALIAAYVPGFIGAALLLNALISGIFSPKESDAAAAQPPRDAT